MNHRESQKHELPVDPVRRKLLQKIALGGLGMVSAGVVLSEEEKILLANLKNETEDTPVVDGISSATPSHTDWGKLEDLKKNIYCQLSIEMSCIDVKFHSTRPFP